MESLQLASPAVNTESAPCQVEDVVPRPPAGSSPVQEVDLPTAAEIPQRCPDGLSAQPQFPIYLGIFKSLNGCSQLLIVTQLMSPISLNRLLKHLTELHPACQI